jgi:hypothetical protein
MVTRGKGALFALLATSVLCGGLGGCFDVGTTNLRVIDNFNSGDLQPSDPNFGPWGCGAVGPAASSIFTCVPDPDTEDGSAFSVLLHVTVTDPPDGGLQQHGGAAVATIAMNAVDFTRYGRIAFDLKLESGGENPLPASALLYVELACMTVLPLGSERHDLYVSQGVPYMNIWHNFALTLENFGAPPALVEPITGGPTACLRHVDGIRFSIDAQLPDGKTGEAFLHVDNVVLE